METTFDVAGSVTLNQVRIPKKGETPEERDHRLAQKAVIEGVRLFTDKDGVLWATSARGGAGTNYRVNLAAGVCHCPGWAHHGYCKHLALARANAAAQEQETPEQCPDCRGEGGRRVYGASGWLSDWTWVPCRRCAKAAA